MKQTNERKKSNVANSQERGSHNEMSASKYSLGDVKTNIVRVSGWKTDFNFFKIGNNIRFQEPFSRSTITNVGWLYFNGSISEREVWVVFMLDKCFNLLFYKQHLPLLCLISISLSFPKSAKLTKVFSLYAEKPCLKPSLVYFKMFNIFVESFKLFLQRFSHIESGENIYLFGLNYIR